MENSQSHSTNGEVGASDALLTTVHARAILDNVEKESPARWPAAVKTLLIGAYRRIEQIDAAISHFTGAVVKIGTDLEVLRREQISKSEYDKLASSHKQLALVVMALQTKVKQAGAGTTGQSASVASESTAAQDPTADTSKSAPPASEVAAPSAQQPQDEVEALMDAAIAASDTTAPVEVASPAPTFVSPTANVRKRRQ